MTETEAHLLRLLYELTELVYYSLREGITRTRVCDMREGIRQDYDKSVWKDRPLRRSPEEVV